MNYESFKDELLKGLSQCFPGLDVEVNKICKNNATSYDAITLYSEKQKLCPCIRLQDYYEDYMNPLKNTSIVDIVTRIREAYLSIITKGDNHASYDAITDFETMKDRIVCRLISSPMNQELLQTVPYNPLNDDLAVTYSIVLRIEEGEFECIRITHSLIEQWHVTLEDLHSTALENTMRLFPVESFRIEEMISHLIAEPIPTLKIGSNGMYVLTNQQGINGATVLIYPNILKDFVSRYQIEEKYLYILPSSVHEVIVLPATNSSMTGMLEKRVREVNENEVAEDEILSNQVFLYHITADRICLLKNGEHSE